MSSGVVVWLPSRFEVPRGAGFSSYVLAMLDHGSFVDVEARCSPGSLKWACIVAASTESLSRPSEPRGCGSPTEPRTANVISRPSCHVSVSSPDVGTPYHSCCMPRSGAEAEAEASASCTSSLRSLLLSWHTQCQGEKLTYFVGRPQKSSFDFQPLHSLRFACKRSPVFIHPLFEQPPYAPDGRRQLQPELRHFFDPRRCDDQTQ